MSLSFRWSPAVCVLAVATACGLFEAPLSTRCDDHLDCPPSYLCSQGLCRAQAAVDSAVATDGRLDDAAPGERPDRDATWDDGGIGDQPRSDVRTDAGIADQPPADAASGPVLFAIHPPLAAAADRIALEGSFPAGATTVVFANALLSLGSLPASTRLLVSVPPGAASGQVHVQVDGATSNGLPLRVTTFQPTLGHFFPHEPQTMAARSMPRLDSARTYGHAVNTGKYLYVVGGVSSNGDHQAVQRARVFADGTLGKFVVDAGRTISALRAGAAAVQVGNRFYLLGGETVDNGTLPTVEYADIGSDGQLTSFATAADLPTPVQDAAAVVVGRYLYLIGGRSDYEPAHSIDAVSRAEIRPGLDLSQFARYSNLNRPRDRSAVAVIGNKLYVIGGTGSLNTLEVAAIQDDGDVARFVTLPNPFTAGRAAALVALPGELCLVGGDDGDNFFSSVQCAAVDANDSLLPVIGRSVLDTARAGAAVAIVHNRFYLVGGHAAGRLDSLAYAPLNARALFGDFNEQITDPLPLAVSHAACAVVGDHLYLTGGNGGLDDTSQSFAVSTIARFQIGLDGVLGSYDPTFNAQLDQPRFMHRLSLDDDELCALGGDGAGYPNPLSDVACAPVDALTAEVGDFMPTRALAVPRSAFAGFVFGGRSYLAGGWNGGVWSLASAQVHHAVLPLAQGNEWLDASPLWEARAQPLLVLLAPAVHLLGGRDTGNNTLDTCETASLDPGAIPSFSQSSAPCLFSARHDASTLVLGDQLFVLGGGYDMEYSIPVNRTTVEFATILGNGTLGTLAMSDRNVPAAAAQGNCLVELGNYIHLLGGSDGSTPTDLRYTARIE